MDHLYARATDPWNSHETVESIVNDETVSDRVLNALHRFGPQTSHQIANRTGLSLVTVSPSVTMLRRADKIQGTGRYERRRQIWEAISR